MKIRHGRALAAVSVLLLLTLATGCSHFGHYPVNAPLEKYNPGYGYIPENTGQEGNSEELMLILSFSGGGTRAAAFSYGVLEELRATEVTIGGKKRRLLDEVDTISGVSGGSFTAGYFGLFGDRIFEDYESRFLKKNIEGILFADALLNPINWFRLSSPLYDRSDLAAEYYDENVFERKTFGDMLKRKGPMVLINATDMSSGQRITFQQLAFDAICSDLSKFPVSRACAASSAVPGVLTPITVKSYAGQCGFQNPPFLKRATSNYRLRAEEQDMNAIQNAEKKKYFHLIDGGVADNLGLRAIEETIDIVGNVWTMMKLSGREKVTKVVFVVVNAETKTDPKWDNDEYVPPFAAMMDSYSTIAIVRYNIETMAVLQESFGRWTSQVRAGRCPPGQVSTEPGSCGDIGFYLVDVRFEHDKDKAEGIYLGHLPTSFHLPPEDVDKLRAAARKILVENADYQKFIRDLDAGGPAKGTPQ